MVSPPTKIARITLLLKLSTKYDWKHPLPSDELFHPVLFRHLIFLFPLTSKFNANLTGLSSIALQHIPKPSPRICLCCQFHRRSQTKRCRQFTSVFSVHQLYSTHGSQHSSFCSFQDSNFFIIQAPCFAGI